LGQARRWFNLDVLASQVEELALGWLHRDPVSAAHSRVGGYLGAGGPQPRPPPNPRLPRGLAHAGEFGGQLGGHGRDGSSYVRLHASSSCLRGSRSADGRAGGRLGESWRAGWGEEKG